MKGFELHNAKDRTRVELPHEFTANIIKTFLFGIDHEDKLGEHVMTNIIKESFWEYPNLFVKWDELFKMRKYFMHHLKSFKNTNIDKVIEALEIIWRENE